MTEEAKNYITPAGFRRLQDDRAVVVDNAGRAHDRVRFGATVTFVHEETGEQRDVTIAGVDPSASRSWRFVTSLSDHGR